MFGFIAGELPNHRITNESHDDDTTPVSNIKDLGSLTRSVIIASEPTVGAAARGVARKAPTWPAGVASVALSAPSLFLFDLYGRMHWRVSFDYYEDMPEDLRRPILQVADGLEIYRIAALFALVFAVWAFRGRPSWLAWAALPIAGHPACKRSSSGGLVFRGHFEG